MKKYVYVRMYRKLLGGYVTSKKKGQLSHRQVIDEMALKGWDYVDHVPVESSGYGITTSYDLVFVKDIKDLEDGYASKKDIYD